MHLKIVEASRGAGAQSVTVKPTGCGFDPPSRRWNIYLLLYFHFLVLVSKQSAALSSATQHAMPPEFGFEIFVNKLLLIIILIFDIKDRIYIFSLY